MAALLIALGILALVAGITQAITVSVAQNGESISKTVPITDEGDLNKDFTIAGGATDSRKTMVIDVSEVKSLMMLSSRDITIETNSGSAPADTIALKANVPWIWYTDCGDALSGRLSADVTDFYFTLASGDAATVQIRGVANSTPP